MEKEGGAPPEEVIRDITERQVAVGAQYPPIARGVALMHQKAVQHGEVHCPRGDRGGLHGRDEERGTPSPVRWRERLGELGLRGLPRDDVGCIAGL